jgi:hypothetical protein
MNAAEQKKRAIARRALQKAINPFLTVTPRPIWARVGPSHPDYGMTVAEHEASKAARALNSKDL